MGGVIVRSNNCRKTDIMLNIIEYENCLNYENVHIYSKQLYRPKYVYFKKLLKPIKGIGYYASNASDNILHSFKAKRNSPIDRLDEYKKLLN